ncbi:hypothetical protein HHI36_023981 [Cryptolaemus montrouzieri]|uniref:Integrase catalytic domain-containing protein n=1 Tax=Cryptolaemus montrouzieri TaxID=559131 RepID=A0ABD2N7K0_9CUCU
MKHSSEKVQVVQELHKPARRNFPRRRTIIKALDDLWNCDLAQMDLYASKNKNHKFILVVIDCFSKYIWATPLKSKSGKEVSHAFRKILQTSGRRPMNLQTDQGKEFFNSHFQELMTKFHINHYHSYSVKKASIVERVIRTLKDKLYKYFSLNGTYTWINILQNKVDEYNSTRHSTTGMKPRDVTKENEKHILNTAYNHIKIARKNKMKLNDIVRISKVKHVFSKGYTPNWTTELFKIVKVQITNPVTYLLEDTQGRPIRGAFYENELQKTMQPDVYLVEKVLRKKRDKVLVRWLGMDESHDSWIHKTNKL